MQTPLWHEAAGAPSLSLSQSLLAEQDFPQRLLPSMAAVEQTALPLLPQGLESLGSQVRTQKLLTHSSSSYLQSL